MKQKLLVIFNCHGYEYIKQLSQSDIFCQKYDIYYIVIYNKNAGTTEEDIELIKNADVILMQYIKNECSFHHSIFLRNATEKCITLIIPHYTFDGYHPKFDINNISEFDPIKPKDYLKELLNSYQLDEEMIKKNLSDQLIHVADYDRNSSIKMYDYVKNNYKKHRMFQSHGYPTYIFFHFAAIEILKLLGIYQTIIPINNNFANNYQYPILPCVVRALDLEFDDLYEYDGIKYDITDYLIIAKNRGITQASLFHDKDFFAEFIKYFKKNQ
jgi:hypothetical protein